MIMIMRSIGRIAGLLGLLALAACGGGGGGGGGGGSTGGGGGAPTLVSIATTPASFALTVGATQQLTVTGTYSDGSTAPLASNITFTSDNTAVATVSATGVVTAVAAGTAHVTASDTAASLTASPVTVTVTGGGTTATLVSIATTPTNFSLTVGATQQLTVTGTYSNNTTAALTSGITFTSDNTAVATVSATGVVTAVAAGTAHVTASDTAASLTAAPVTVTVTSGGTTATLVSIATTPANFSLAIGATQTLTVTGTYSNNTTATLTSGITFSTDNAAVATVSATGVVTAVAAGTAHVTASDSAASLTASPVTVTVTSATAANNTLPVVVDSGPALLLAANYSAANILYATITVCSPGSTTACQSIDHVQIDTGSVGFQIVSEALTGTANLPAESVNGQPLRECVQFADGYTWGSMVQGDVYLGSSPSGSRLLANFPVHLIGDKAAGTAPSTCVQGRLENTVVTFGANAILGIGNFLQDCGSYCVSNAPSALYYVCPSTGCTPTSVPLTEQLTNPVGALSADNNGVVVSLNAVNPAGATTASGTVYFGISTQANNAFPATAQFLAVDPYGTLATTFNGSSMTGSVIDSGSNAYFFNDTQIPACTGTNSSYFCPSSSVALSGSIQGVTYNGTTNTRTPSGPAVPVNFTIDNADTLFSSTQTLTAFPTLGGPNGSVGGIISGFDWGLPFFYGRNVYVLFEQNTLAGTTGPAIGF